MRKALMLVAISLLAGCTPRQDADAVWQDYLGRLENVLDRPAPQNTMELRVFDIPRLSAPESDYQVSLLDVFKLDACSLGELISNHNSALGKVAPPSQELIYHIGFVQQAPACIALFSADNPQIATTLQLALADKQSTAVSMMKTMLTNDASMRASLFAGTQSLNLNSAMAGVTETQAALRRLVHIQHALQAGDYNQINTADIEATLEVFYQNPVIADYLAGARDSLLSIQQINALLAQGAELNECKPGYNHRKQEILATVFRKAYLPGAQAYLARLRQIQLALGPDLITLYADTPYEALVNYYFAENDVDSLPGQLDAQIKLHVAWWQALQDSCGNLM